MISPYDIQQRVQKYVEDSSQYPLIRELINEAINYICQASDKGKDWSFLVNTATIPVVSSGTVATAELPSDFRSIIHVEESAGYTSELYGRTIILKIADGHTAPANVAVKYYRAHPPVYALANHDGTIGPDYDPSGSDAAWTPTNPPASLILLPDEAADAIVYETLLLMRLHEIEVASNEQFCEKVVATTLEFMKSNYQLQIDYRTPVTEDNEGNQTENLTVGWLVGYGKTLCGGERDEYQLISLVNRTASEFADFLRLRGSQRPKVRNSLSDALPTFGGVAGYSMAGNTTEKSIPAPYWQAGMRYQVLKATKQLGELDLGEYREMLKHLSELFYSLKTDGVYDYSTYGGMMDYLRTIWKNQRDDSKLWALLNQTIADVMRKINTNQLLTCKEYTVTDEKKNNFSLPDDFKVAVKVTIGDRYEIIGRAFTTRGRTMAEQQLWQFPGERRPLWHSNYFSLVAKELVFHHDLVPGMKVKLWYYPRHVWPYKTVDNKKAFDLAKELPIDADLLSHALQAKVAMENGDMNQYKIHAQDFADALADYNEAQNRSLPEDARIIAAVPNVDYLLACNTFGFGAF